MPGLLKDVHVYNLYSTLSHVSSEFSSLILCKKYIHTWHFLPLVAISFCYETILALTRLSSLFFEVLFIDHIAT